MNFRRLKLVGLVAVITAVVVTACKDDFSEEDFLRLQNELAIQQDSVKRLQAFKDNGAETAAQAASYVAALNEAGDLMSLSILVRSDDKPLAGASVQITGADLTSGRTTGTQLDPVTTDANGVALFPRVAIGGASIKISKTGYVSATALIDSGTPSAPVAINVNGVTRYVAPTKRFENLSLDMFASSSTAGAGASLATVTGTVTIETDLTNTTPELVTTGTVIKANLSSLFVNYNATGNIWLTSYQLEPGSGLAEATVDANGKYTMVVPATEGGLSNLSFILPTITGNQTLAINGIDDGTGTIKAIPTGAEVRSNISTQWGTGLAYDAVPSVVGAKVTFAAPPAAGTGFAIKSATPQARSLDVTTISSTANVTDGNTVYKINNRGAGFTSSPTVTITGTGTGATATAALQGFISKINIGSGGTGYGNNATVRVHMAFLDVNNNNAVTLIPGMTFIPIQADGNGVLPIGDLTLPNSFGYLGNANPFVVSGVGGFVFRLTDTNNVDIVPGTPAQVNVSRNVELASITITNGGSGFTAAPTFTITGGGASTAATVDVVNMGFQWNFELDNAASSGYQVLPAAIDFLYPATNVAAATTAGTVDLVSVGLGNVVTAGATFRNQLTVSGGVIEKLNSAFNFRTSAFRSAAPSVIVTPEVPSTHTVALQAGDINSTTGEIISIPAGRITGGNAYSSEVNPTISAVGSNGSGANYRMIYTLDNTSKEYTWNGAALTKVSGGSGYLQNVNRKTQENHSNPGIPTLHPGKTYIVDIRYGTGDRLVSVN